MVQTESIMLESLEAQLGCYRRLLKLSGLQRDYVRENQTDELLNVLQNRAGVLSEISRLERDVSPLKQQWAAIAPTLAPQQRDAAQRMLAEARSLLQAITQADQDDVLLLQQRKLNVGKQIQQTATARNINNRYAASAYGTSTGDRLNVQQ